MLKVPPTGTQVQIGPKVIPRILPPTAIVLSGGAARGDFEVGALYYLLRVKNIGRVDMVCGTSVGALNGVAIAQGPWGIDQLVNIWLNLHANNDMYLSTDAFTNVNQQLQALGVDQAQLDEASHEIVPFGFIDSIGPSVKGAQDAVAFVQNLQALANSQSLFNLIPIAAIMNGIPNLDQNVRASGIQLRMGLVSLESGKLRYVNENGNFVDADANGKFVNVAGDPAVPLGQAAIASASMPIIFPPIKIGNDNYVDGGVREIVPMSAAVDAGMQVIYAIVCATPTAPPEDAFDGRGLMDIVNRTVDLMTDQMRQNELNPPRGWNLQDYKIINMTLDVHDGMTIDPYLMKTAMSYGFMRAYDIVDSKNVQDAMNSSDAIIRTILELQEAKAAAREDWGPPSEHTASLAAANRKLIQDLLTELQNNISSRRTKGYATPDDNSPFWNFWQIAIPA
jgi:NTE family protein